MKKTIISFILLSSIVVYNAFAINPTINNESLSIASKYSNVLICISNTASKYHSYYCYGLKNCTHEISSVTVAQAVSKGYSPCGYCYK